MTARTARRPRRSSRAEEPEPEKGYEPDPEEQGDERPTRRSASRPSRRAAPRRDDAEDGGSRRSRGRSRDEEDEGDDGKATVDGGWGSWRQRRAETSGFADDFKVEYKEKYLVMFLDDAPFAAFNEHWIEEMPKGKKKSYVCIGKKAGCPLCVTLGEDPSARAMFNILEFIKTDDGYEPVLKVWTAGSGVVQEIEENAEDVGLEGNYFKVSKSKSGRNGPTKYSVVHQKPRDVEEDPWNMEPLSDDEIEEWMEKRYDKSYVKMPSRKTLQDVADEVMALD